MFVCLMLERVSEKTPLLGFSVHKGFSQTGLSNLSARDKNYMTPGNAAIMTVFELAELGEPA